MFKKEESWVPEDINFKDFKNNLAQQDDIEWSDSVLERISVSGDLSGTPYYHWRWKEEYLAKMVIWPKNKAQLVKVVKLANSYNIPITLRGGGTSYFGESVPTMGEIVLDLKSMDNFNLDKNKKIMTAQSGVTFGRLIDFLAGKPLELPAYPSSALSATVGGCLSTKGSIGIGSYRNGAFSKHILGLKFITSDGKIKHVKNGDLIDKVLKSYGILGIIMEVKFKLMERNQKHPFLYGVSNITNLQKIIDKLTQREDIYYISFFDRSYFQKLYPDSQEFSFYVFFIIERDNLSSKVQKYFESKELQDSKGTFLGQEISEKYYQNLLKDEVRLKKDVPVLMLQSLKVTLEDVTEITKKFKKLSKERNLTECIQGTMNSNKDFRLNLFTLTDNDAIVHFLSSKGILHRMVKFVYKNNLGQLYDFGLYNGIYLEKFETKRRDRYQKLKKKYDPDNIFNPWKLVQNIPSFGRINILFELDLLWRKIAVKLGLAKDVIEPINKDIKSMKTGIRRT